jgi:antitoxin component YwqK of YwqJK toxin-antitoxin module
MLLMTTLGRQDAGAAGGFILIWAMICFPFIGLPLGIIFAIIAMAVLKTKVDKTSIPKEQKSNTKIFVVFIVISVILVLAARFFAIHWIKEAIHPYHADGIESIYDSQTHKLRSEIPYKNGAINGVVKEYDCVTYELASETPYIDGKINGVRKNYFTDGRYEETPYKNGKIDGVQKIYCKKDSQVHYEVDWENGQGIKSSGRHYDKDGNLIGRIDYNKWTTQYCK